MTQPRVHAQFDEATHTVSYVVWDPATRRAAIIDPVLDYDHRTGRVSHRSADDLLGFVADQGLSVDWVLETHAHADHLSAAPYLKEKTGAPIGIGARITEVQRTFAPVFGLDDVSGDIYGGDFRRQPELAAEFMKHVKWQSRWGYYLQIGAATGWTSVHWLCRLKQRTLVMAGRDDPLIHTFNARLMRSLIPNSELKLFDCGHLFLMTRQEESVRAINEFLDKA